MKALPAPDLLVRQWLQNPHAITAAALAFAMVFLGIAGWLIRRNLRYNEPGLRAPLALTLAIFISSAAVFGADRLPNPWGIAVGVVFCGLAALLFFYADHRRFVRNPAGRIIADRWHPCAHPGGHRRRAESEGRKELLQS